MFIALNLLENGLGFVLCDLKCNLSNLFGQIFTHLFCKFHIVDNHVKSVLFMMYDSDNRDPLTVK